MEKNPNLEWLYDYFVQFLKSPAWSLPILQFIDDNCTHFDNDEENKLIYSSIFEVISIQQFGKMIDTLLENLLRELNISTELFVHIVEMGMSSPEDRRAFEQIIACDNYLSFKKLMTRRNKEIEVEVVKSMKTEGVANEADLEIALEKQEIAEVGYALALSIAWEEEQRRKAREAEEELQRALRESESEYKAAQSRTAKEEEERRRKLEEDERIADEKRKRDEAERLRLLKEKESKELDEKRRKEEEERRQLEEAERKRREQEELDRVMAETQRLQKIKEEEERKRQEMMRLKLEELKRQRELEAEEMRKKAEADAERIRLEIEAFNAGKDAPERTSRPRMSLIPMQAMQLDVDVLDLNKGRVDLTKELQEAENLRRMTQNIMRKQGESGRRESVIEREEKMLKQRELLLAKKKMEREQQMKEFKDSGGFELSQEGIEGAKDTGGFSRKRNSVLEARRSSYKAK